MMRVMSLPMMARNAVRKPSRKASSKVMASLAALMNACPTTSATASAASLNRSSGSMGMMSSLLKPSSRAAGCHVLHRVGRYHAQRLEVLEQQCAVVRGASSSLAWRWNTRRSSSVRAARSSSLMASRATDAVRSASA